MRLVPRFLTSAFKVSCFGFGMVLLELSTPLAFAGESVPTLAVIDPSSKETFEKLRLPQLKQKLERCSECRIVNLTPYDDKGEFNSANLKAQIAQVPATDSVLLILWNRKAKPEDQDLQAQVKNLVQSGSLVVATAGRPGPEQPTLTLSRTLWGQVKEVVIIGELGDKEALLPGTFFGPQMLTALRTPSEAFGQDMAAMMFSTKLVAQLKKKNSQDWLSFLREKKDKARRMWPNLEDFFGYGH